MTASGPGSTLYAQTDVRSAARAGTPAPFAPHQQPAARAPSGGLRLRSRYSQRSAPSGPPRRRCCPPRPARAWSSGFKAVTNSLGNRLGRPTGQCCDTALGDA